MGLNQSVTDINVTGSRNLAAGRDIIQHIHHESQTKELVKTFRIIENPVPYFTGRQEIVQQIHKLLKACATKTSYAERIVVLRGLGGMGKSELTRQYVKAYIDDPIIKNVAWIDAETKESTETSFKNLAQTLKLDIKDKTTEHLSAEFYRHFSDHIKIGLIIFDNVEQLRDQNPYHGILKYLPTQHLNCVPLILITSRIHDWEIPVERDCIIEIPGLSTEAAVAFLYKCLKTKTDSDVTQAFRRLAEAVEGYPLGLTLAASTITSYGSEDIVSGVQTYITRLDASKQDWIQDKLSASAVTNYKLLMSAVWDTTIRKIQTVEKDAAYALELLSIIAYFPADDIKSDEILNLYKVVFERSLTAFQRGMHILKTYSLTSFFTNQSKIECIRIHRHVQRCARTMLEINNDYSYLGLVASFRVEKYVSEKTKCFKNSLKVWPWPREVLLEFAQLFSKLLDKDIARDMRVCLLKVLASLPYKTRYFKILFDLIETCRPNGKNLNSQDLNEIVFNAQEENVFLLAAKEVFSNDNFLTTLYKGESDVRSTISILWKEMYYNAKLVLILKDQLKSTFGNILCDFANNARRFDNDSMTLIYHFFAFYYNDDTCNDAQKYLAVAIKSYSKYQATTKWYFPFTLMPTFFASDFNLRLPFQSLSKFFDIEDCSWKSQYAGYVDTFFDEGGAKMLADTLKHDTNYYLVSIWSFVREMSDMNDMLQLLVEITRYPECSIKLAMGLNFMDNLKDLTRQIWDSSYQYYVILLIWFGLFTSNTRLRDPYGKDWTVASVADEMTKFVEIYKHDFLSKSMSMKDELLKLKRPESILNTYIMSPKGVHDDIVAETATLMLNMHLSVSLKR